MSERDKAAESADKLLELLIQHQPELIKSAASGPSNVSGEKVGQYIEGLRSKLIDMYNLRARG